LRKIGSTGLSGLSDDLLTAQEPNSLTDRPTSRSNGFCFLWLENIDTPHHVETRLGASLHNTGGYNKFVFYKDTATTLLLYYGINAVAND